MKTLEVLVKFKGRPKHVFEFIIHPQEPSSLILGDEFYIKWGKGLPKETQHEIQVLTTFGNRHVGKIHTHKSADGKLTMMCYPLPIPSLGIALEKIIVWSVGTAYTQETGNDFQQIFKGNVQAFLKEMESSYHLKMGSINFIG